MKSVNYLKHNTPKIIILSLAFLFSAVYFANASCYKLEPALRCMAKAVIVEVSVVPGGTCPSMCESYVESNYTSNMRTDQVDPIRYIQWQYAYSGHSETVRIYGGHDIQDGSQWCARLSGSDRSALGNDYVSFGFYPEAGSECPLGVANTSSAYGIACLMGEGEGYLVEGNFEVRGDPVMGRPDYHDCSGCIARVTIDNSGYSSPCNGDTNGDGKVDDPVFTWENIGGIRWSPSYAVNYVSFGGKCFSFGACEEEESLKAEPLYRTIWDGYQALGFNGAEQHSSCCYRNSPRRNFGSCGDAAIQPAWEECDYRGYYSNPPCQGACSDSCSCQRCQVGAQWGVCGQFLPRFLPGLQPPIAGLEGGATPTTFVMSPGSAKNSGQQAAQNKKPVGIKSSLLRFWSSVGGIVAAGKEKNTLTGQPELIDCFDYYTFGSVEFSQEAIKAKSYTPGSNLEFRVQVTNKNNYPVADGMVFVKIYQENQNRLSPDFLIDEFPAKENINLWPGEIKEITFNWKIPEGAVGGRYKAVPFFSASKQFNLSGLSFTPDIYDKMVIFNVVEGQDKSFWFDVDNIKFNDKKITLSTWIPTIDQGETASMSFSIKNQVAGGEASIVLELYPFDLLNEEKKLSQYTETKNISLNQDSIPLQFSLAGLEPGAYVAKITLKNQNWQSILNIRFAVKGEKGRFIFTALDKFPLKSGEKYSIFSCFSNSADFTSSFRGKIDIQLRDQETGKTLAQTVYQGEITPQVMAIKQDFSKIAKNSGKLVLVSQLYDEQGNLADRVETLYDIGKFTQLEKEKPSRLAALLAGIGLALLIILIILYFIFAKKRWPGATKIK